MKNYNINDDKHIIIINQIMIAMEEDSLRIYVTWLKTHSQNKFILYNRLIKKRLKVIPNTKYVSATKKPFGFRFTIYDNTTYQFAARKIGNWLKCECFQI